MSSQTRLLVTVLLGAIAFASGVRVEGQALVATAPLAAGVGSRMAAGSNSGTQAADSTQPTCPPQPTPTLVKEGKSIFTGAGNCYACHGPGAEGTPLAPTLHQHKWLDADSSYAGIEALINTGVPQPKQHPAPMPAKGGADLTAQQVCAVAAYVYSLSH